MSDYSFFLDSGAFSAETQGKPIDIDEYISFIKENEKYIDIYANLDDISDPEKTLENQKYMESKGLNPLPCFHYGEDIKYLKYYIENYEYIAIGGMVPISNSKLYPWLDDIFKNHLCDEQGYPKIKVHGFGLSALKIMIRYPWYSVDSTTWIKCSRFGDIYVPHRKDNEWNYLTPPHKVAVSELNKAPDHYYHLSSRKREIVDLYMREAGLALGKSIQNEKGELEIITPGISNDYKIRDKMVIYYFTELEKKLIYPKPFVLTDEKQRMSFL